MQSNEGARLVRAANPVASEDNQSKMLSNKSLNLFKRIVISHFNYYFLRFYY